MLKKQEEKVVEQQSEVEVEAQAKPKASVAVQKLPRILMSLPR